MRGGGGGGGCGWGGEVGVGGGGEGGEVGVGGGGGLRSSCCTKEGRVRDEIVGWGYVHPAVPSSCKTKRQQPCYFIKVFIAFSQL